MCHDIDANVAFINDGTVRSFSKRYPVYVVTTAAFGWTMTMMAIWTLRGRGGCTGGLAHA